MFGFCGELRMIGRCPYAGRLLGRVKHVDGREVIIWFPKSYFVLLGGVASQMPTPYGEALLFS